VTPEFDEGDLIDDVAVVLLAAGSGSRLGSSRPKAFVGCAGKVLLAHSLLAFEAHEAVDSIVLVVPEDWVGPAEVLVDDLGCDRVSSIEVGGDSRAASVRAGLDAVANRRETAVLVHDAARPVVPDELIERVLAPLAEGYDAVVPGLAVHDTVKRVGPGGRDVVETVPREQLLLAQTPQACRADVLIAALAAGDLGAITDCSQAVEMHGGKVCAVAGDARAHKVTTAEDLARVERELGGPAQGEDVDDASDQEHPDDLHPLDDDDLAGATTNDG
jgi:2-C-methyl-D-erythritol 4-phosphate cytidylyltransferase